MQSAQTVQQTVQFKTKGELPPKLIASRLNLELDDDNSLSSKTSWEKVGLIEKDGFFKIYLGSSISQMTMRKASDFATKVVVT
jgi:hypothetical protein